MASDEYDTRTLFSGQGGFRPFYEKIYSKLMNKMTWHGKAWFKRLSFVLIVKSHKALCRQDNSFGYYDSVEQPRSEEVSLQEEGKNGLPTSNSMQETTSEGSGAKHFLIKITGSKTKVEHITDHIRGLNGSGLAKLASKEVIDFDVDDIDHILLRHLRSDFKHFFVAESKASQRCLNSAGALLPSADSCTDEIDTAKYCLPRFGTGLGTGVTSRPAGTLPTATDLDACNKLDNIIYALKCRYTCATCCDLPQYDCEDDKTTSFDCAAIRKMCNTVKSIMIKLCPATCGFCLEIKNNDPNCFDRINNCKKDYEPFGFCTNSIYLKDMTEYCAKTCNLCDKKSEPAQADKQEDPVASATVSRGNTRADAASEAGDKASNCKGNEELCDSPAAEYREMMLKECAETCKKYLADKKKRQRTEKSSEDCFDESRYCAHWKRNNFCISTFYTSEQVEKECAKTCEYC
uniref:ShKT domain-containing protein n=1 Tax=Ditylenchus dipsaci TaxID=166011 RepID=A0A915CVF8_9BILA